MGDPATYSVDLEELDLLVAEMTACERGLEELAADVEREMAALREVWEGLAAEAQRAAHEEWATGMAEMRQALGRLRAAARTAHDNYTAAGAANAAMWERLR
jgi:WXG100 family type VII secretion target